MLLLKREEFSLEQEVRVLYRDVARKRSAGENCTFPVDPKNLFDEILFDQRLPKADRDRHKSELRALGYRGPIRTSVAYDFPPFEIILEA